MRKKTVLVICKRLSTQFQSISNYTTKVKNRSQWKPVVGLEIHAQINSKSKLFSGASTSFGCPPNENVSVFDAAIPGTLPVLNKKCVKAGILTALALSCKINSVSLFDRKHYFYADLPAGYQITQQRAPLAEGGFLSFQVMTPGIEDRVYIKTSKLKQLQLEQDSGKTIVDDVNNRSLIDLNRAGVALMELVFEPDLSSGEEAAALVKELSLILSYLDTCSCKMEEGALRVDANVSLHKEGEELGTRTEVKNIGSVRGVAKAVEYEIQRQLGVLQSGGVVTNETRAWDVNTATTLPMRDKEIKQDYRFMPEPNLPPLRVNTGETEIEGLIYVAKLKESMPELPEQTRNRLKKEYKLHSLTAMRLVNEDKLLDYFMSIIGEKKTRTPKLVANILVMELLTLVNKGLVNLETGNFPTSAVGEVVDLLQSGRINLVTARRVLEEVANDNSQSPTEMVEAKGWTQITDVDELKRICQEAVDSNLQAAAKYREGKVKVFSALVGHVAKATNKRANLEKATEILRDILGKPPPPHSK